MLMNFKSFGSDDCFTWHVDDTKQNMLSYIVIVATNKGLLFNLLWENGENEEITLSMFDNVSDPLNLTDMRFIKLPSVRPEATRMNFANLTITDGQIRGVVELIAPPTSVIKSWTFSEPEEEDYLDRLITGGQEERQDTPQTNSTYQPEGALLYPDPSAPHNVFADTNIEVPMAASLQRREDGVYVVSVNPTDYSWD